MAFSPMPFFLQRGSLNDGRMERGVAECYGNFYGRECVFVRMRKKKRWSSDIYIIKKGKMMTIKISALFLCFLSFFIYSSLPLLHTKVKKRGKKLFFLLLILPTLFRTTQSCGACLCPGQCCYCNGISCVIYACPVATNTPSTCVPTTNLPSTNIPTTAQHTTNSPSTIPPSTIPPSTIPPSTIPSSTIPSSTVPSSTAIQTSNTSYTSSSTSLPSSL